MKIENAGSGICCSGVLPNSYENSNIGLFVLNYARVCLLSGLLSTCRARYPRGIGCNHLLQANFVHFHWYSVHELFRFLVLLLTKIIYYFFYQAAGERVATVAYKLLH